MKRSATWRFRTWGAAAAVGALLVVAGATGSSALTQSSGTAFSCHGGGAIIPAVSSETRPKADACGGFATAGVRWQ